MKTFIAFLLLMSFSAMAAKENTISLTGDSRFSLAAGKNSSVLYVAANPTCMEMTNSHGVPFPTDKSKRTELNITKNVIKVKQKLGGFCQYRFANTSVDLVLNGKTMGLRLFDNKNAPKEIDIICSEVQEYNTDVLRCRLQGEAKTTYNLSLSLDLSSNPKVNVILE